MKYILFTLSCLLSIVVYSQNESELYEIKLNDNSKFKGYIIKESDDSLYLTNPLFGTIGFKNDDIKYIVRAKNNVMPYEKEIMYKNTYIFTDNALMPKKESTYLDIQELLAMKMSYAISNSLCFEIGTTVLDEYFEPGGFYPLVGIKYGFSFSQNLHLAAKSIRVFGGNNFFINSILGTIGNASNNLSFGLHYAKHNEMEYNFFSSTSFVERREELGFSIAGMVDLSKKTDLRFEYINRDKNRGILSLGLGLNYKYMSTTLGFFAPINSTKTRTDYNQLESVLPYFSFKIPFYTPNKKSSTRL